MVVVEIMPTLAEQILTAVHYAGREGATPEQLACILRADEIDVAATTATLVERGELVVSFVAREYGAALLLSERAKARLSLTVSL
jgi:hypothetical protein